MLIKAVHIENFRSILNETMNLDNLTILVGANGAGKSTFLRAIDLFYSPNPVVTVHDFFASDPSRELVISITYANLNDKAKERFADYLDNTELTVEMIITCTTDKPTVTCHGSRLQNPDFAVIYETATKNKIQARTAYNELRTQEIYKSLPPASTYDEVQGNLQAWENSNPNRCKRKRDDGQFFGLKQAGRNYLFEYSQFLFISAVRDASQDSVEGKGSALTRLMDLVVRNALASREDLAKFKQTTQEQYEGILKPENLTELTALRDQLSATLQTFVPNARIELSWQPLEQFNIPLPKANVGLVEDGYQTKVEMTGHGLQRAFIFTLLQQLTLAQRPAPQPSVDRDDDSDLEIPSLIIAIEEPELYQHPNRQRYFGRVLRQFAHGELTGVVHSVQIVCATHSPLFIDIAHFDEIRLIRKELPSDKKPPKVSRVFQARYQDIVSEMQRIRIDPNYTVEKLKTLLPQLMTTFINEGFFADVVVMVEGETDRAVILEVAERQNLDLEGMGIGIVPAGGKGNIVIPAVIFDKLGIPTYLLWDCDQKTDNNELFSFVKHQFKSGKGKKPKPTEDLILPNFATFHKTREYTMETEIGKSLFNTLVSQCRTEVSDGDLKKPIVVRWLTRLAYNNGKSLPSIEKILAYIVTLRDKLFEIEKDAKESR